MKKVLIDTGVLLANIIQTDQHHHAADRMLLHLSQTHSKLYTTRYILAEVYTRIRAWHPHILHTIISEIELDISQGMLSLLEVTPDIWSEAKSNLLKYDKIKLSFTDCTTYTLYKHLKLDEICTFDEDFTKLKANTTQMSLAI